MKLSKGISMEAPPGSEYLLGKARKYLKVGPDIYRTGDFFKMPSADYPESILTIIQHGMEQISRFQGFSRENPFEGLGVEGFYALLMTLHFELVLQRAYPLDEVTFLDEMQVKHLVTGKEIVLYNKVLKSGYECLKG